MGLSYHFSFRASPQTSGAQLMEFLRGVEAEAQQLGFAPTIVIDGPFDSQERREFARRIARPLTIEDRRLVGIETAEGLCWTAIPAAGIVRLAPTYCAVLVVTDSKGIESVFGFLQFPTVIHNRQGAEVMRVPEAGTWRFGSFIDSPDPRYRKLVARFREAGYLESELDEFVAPSAR